jgi:Zn-dependent protease with chaperone function
LLAHELGHLFSFDSQIVLALRRFVLYPVNYISRGAKEIAPGALMRLAGKQDAVGCCIGGGGILSATFLLAISGGGLGVFLMRPWWYAFWRDREFFADQVAKQCGQGDILIEYLEKYQIFDMAVPFFMSDKPYNEERIARLLDS